MVRLVQRALRRAGFELIRRRPHVPELLAAHGVDLVLDVGASVGRFAEHLRARGYRGRIVSFEPLPEAFEELRRKAARDGAWTALPMGLGSEERSSTLHVSRATDYSSVLTPMPALVRFAGPAVETSREQAIILQPLDAVFPTVVRNGERPFLKLDTQGYEREIVLGARTSLARMIGAQLELSPSPLYEGESTLAEMITFLDYSGFVPVLIEPVTYDRTTPTLLRIRCVFLRKDLAPPVARAR
jgi:FkbM family methyltransferase